MLNDRGYFVKESDLKMTLDDFKYHYARASVDEMYDAHTHCATQSVRHSSGLLPTSMSRQPAGPDDVEEKEGTG